MSVRVSVCVCVCSCVCVRACVQNVSLLLAHSGKNSLTLCSWICPSLHEPQHNLDIFMHLSMPFSAPVFTKAMSDKYDHGVFKI